MMRVRLSLKPGQDGTKGLLARYGKRLVRVRYRYDEQTKQRVKTVELVVARKEWHAAPKSTGGETVVAVRVDWREAELQRQVKAAGGSWDPAARVWRLRWECVVRLGLEGRVVEGAI